MTEALSTRYTRTAEGTYLAYQVSGDGPIDLVLPITGSAAIELIWEEPEVSQFISRLASFCRLITFDPRGFGSSGRLDAGAVPAVQAWKDDIGAVMDAVGTDNAAFLSWGESSGATMFFAATYPERVRSLVLVNAYARYARDDATPWGLELSISFPPMSRPSRKCGAAVRARRPWHRAWSKRRMHDNIGGASSALRPVRTYWRKARVP